MGSDFITTAIQNYFVIGVIVTCFLIGYIIKNYTPIPNKYIPIIMIGIGMIANIIFGIMDNNPITYITFLSGGTSGLTSCGFYDLIKKSLGVNQSDNNDNRG